MTFVGGESIKLSQVSKGYIGMHDDPDGYFHDSIAISASPGNVRRASVCVLRGACISDGRASVTGFGDW